MVFEARFLLFSLLLVGNVRAWGEHGHRTVGYLAQLYFTPEAETLFNDLIKPTDVFDISDGAVWADNFSVQSRYPWSKPLHFIDANDSPPDQCKVNFDADCDRYKKCVVAAITNFTAQVNNPSVLPKFQGEALKFLLHFLGDITQPLHTEHKCRGGTKLMVQWGKPGSQKENLHAVWDKFIPQKLLGYKRPKEGQSDNEYDKELSFKWAQDLKQKLDEGSIVIGSDCIDIGNAQKCALKWASEANAYVCSYVLRNVGISTGPDGCETCCAWDWQGPADVSKEYYDGAVPIVESQIAKAGWRLGHWINALAEERAQMKETGVMFADEILQVQPKEEI